MKLVSIEKNNKIRQIILLNEQEKEVRRKLKEKLNSFIEYPPCIYSFVKERSAKQAYEEVKRNIEGFDSYLKCDIKRYFQSIKTDILIQKLRNLNIDEKLIGEIEDCLHIEREHCNVEGLSIGSPLSNVLSNLYLIEFDRKFSVRLDLKYFRFCDDMLFLCNKNIIDEIKDELLQYEIELNFEKTIFGNCSDGFRFLGFDVKPDPNINNRSFSEKFCLNVELQGQIENLLNNFSEEKYKIFINKLLKNSVDIDSKKYIFENITGKIGKVYEYVFRHIMLKENKEELLEKMVNEHNYKAAIKFESLLQEFKNSYMDYEKIRELFFIRDGEYYLSEVGEKKDYIKIDNFLSDDVLDKHMNGEVSIAVRLDRQDERSSVLVLDVDESDNEKAKNKAELIYQSLEEKNIACYMENSGKKGYHIWIFFKENIKIRNLNEFANKILKGLNLENIEIIPKYNFLSETQNIIKLPFGIHPETGNPSEFIDITSLNQICINDFKEDDAFIKDFFGKITEDFKDAGEIASKCHVSRMIIEQGLSSGNMNHFDRLVLLYIFFHIPEGRAFIHHVMKHMDNYSYNITERNIEKAPENPVSCKKIKEYFKGTELVSQCTCRFNLPEGIYSSPVMYSNSNKYLENSLKATIKETLNEIFKLKMERDELDKKIRSQEKKLNLIFDELEEEAVQIDMGILKRTSENGKSNWTISLDIER